MIFLLKLLRHTGEKILATELTESKCREKGFTHFSQQWGKLTLSLWVYPVLFNTAPLATLFPFLSWVFLSLAFPNRVSHLPLSQMHFRGSRTNLCGLWAGASLCGCPSALPVPQRHEQSSPRPCGRRLFSQQAGKMSVRWKVTFSPNRQDKAK